MLLLWRIRYLDTRDRLFKDRDLWLSTDALEAAIRCAVEAVEETGDRWGMLRYRHLFREGTLEEVRRLHPEAAKLGFRSRSLPDYLEDENGKRLTHDQMAKIVTGNPAAVALPPGAKQHDIAYMFADQKPIHLETITLPADELKILGYFERDLKELSGSSFLQDGAGTLTWGGNEAPVLQTAVDDEAIRSIVTVFRRLYMEKEPASFLKAAEIFTKALAGHPIADWMRAEALEYKKSLQTLPGPVPVAQFPFSRKRLIDVFLYTQYAHQPDERRDRQYKECLSAVGGRQSVLTWLFLEEIWERSMHFKHAGGQIVFFYDLYCRSHAVSGEVIKPITYHNPGIGALETNEGRQRRIMTEKAEELAKALWHAAGKPDSGFIGFVPQATRQLAAALGNGPPLDDGVNEKDSK